MAEPAPLILTDAYLELGGVELYCLLNHIELTPDVKKVDVTTMCGVQEHPGAVKWFLRLTLYQSFDAGGTDEVLAAAMEGGVPVDYVVRPTRAPVSVTNPEFSGLVIPTPYTLFGGDAGAASEVQIEWTMTAPPTRSTTATPGNGAERAESAA
jgi:hypothetical protein